MALPGYLNNHSVASQIDYSTVVQMVHTVKQWTFRHYGRQKSR